MLNKALGYGALGATIGAATIGSGLGAGYIASQTGSQNAGGAMVAGGALGLGASIGTTALAFNLPKVASWAGKTSLGVGTNIYNWAKSDITVEALKNYGANKLNIAKSLGKSALKTGVNLGSVGALTALKAGAKYGNIATGMFSADPTGKKLFKANVFGKTAILGGGAVVAGASAVNTFNQLKRGQSDGEVLRATPQPPVSSSQMRDAGATGDLAFAMRKLRHG